MRKLKLIPDSYIIICTFLQNIHRSMLFAQTRYQAKQKTRLYLFFTFWQKHIYCWYLYFLCGPFLFIVVISMVRWSLQYDFYFYFSGIWWTYTFIRIYIKVFNQRFSQMFLKIQKIIIHFKETFHRQICIHFSTHYEINK